jgi:hypothetical protein
MGEVIPFPLQKRSDAEDREAAMLKASRNPSEPSSTSSEAQPGDPQSPASRETPTLVALLLPVVKLLQQPHLGIQSFHLFWSPGAGLVVSANQSTPNAGPEPRPSEDLSELTDEQVEEAYKQAEFETLQES